MERSNYSYWEVEGMKVPYQPNPLTGSRLIDGEERPVEPPHVTAIRFFLRNRNAASFQHALNTIGHECLRAVLNLYSFRFPAWQRVRILGSGTIPWGQYWLSQEGVIVNSLWASQYDKDHDGDLCSLLLPASLSIERLLHPKTWKMRTRSFMELQVPVVWRIYPKTRETVLLQPAKSFPKDSFSDFTVKKATSILNENASIDKKTSLEVVTDYYDQLNSVTDWDKVRDLWTDPQVGLVTTQLNVWELSLRKGKKLWDALSDMYVDPVRRLAVEGRLKLSRKKEHTGEAAVGLVTETLPFQETGLTFNRVPSIGPDGKRSLPIYPFVAPNRVTALNGRAINWVFFRKDLSKFFYQLLTICPVSDKWFRNATGEQIADEENETPGPTRYDFTLISRLIEIGALQVREIPHASGVPAVQIYLQAPGKDGQWHKVAGIDEKRDGEFCEAAILYPVWDSINNILVHPITCMADWFGHIEELVVSRPSMGDWRNWNTHEFFLDKFSTKRAILHRNLFEYFSVFGDNVRGSNTNGADYSDHIQNLIESTVVLRFWTDDMDEQIKLAQASRMPFNWVGAKGKNPEARKCLLTDEDNRPLTAPLGCAYARAGKTRSQQVRTTHSANLRVAIVDSSATGQPWITKTGIDKLRAEVFQARIVGSDHPDAEAKDTYNIHGELCRIHLAKPRLTALVPKVVDACGNKFIPRRIGQVTEAIPEFSLGARLGYETPIDLLIPFQELLAKGCLHTFCKEATETEILVHGHKVKALVLDWEFGRSGIPSENTVQGLGTDILRGMDGTKYAVDYTALGLGEMKWVEKQDEYLDTIHSFGQVFLGEFPIYIPDIETL